MGNTASNGTNEIATKGTTHVPQTESDTDIGINPATGIEAPFENKVKMPLLAPGTTRTYICHQPVWTAAHVVGPVSYPSKAPFIVGKQSGTHIDESKPTAWSLDAIFESHGVIRTNDTTTQNHGNTNGYVDSGIFEGKSAAEIAFLKAHCTIVEMTGINTVKVVQDGVSMGTGADVARNLGYPGAKEGVPPYYIEILSSTKVDFTVTRKDVTKKAPEDPKCWRPGVHTKWRAQRTGEGDVTIERKGTDKFTVTEAMTELEWGDHDMWAKPTWGSGFKDKTVWEGSKPDGFKDKEKKEQIKKEKLNIKEGKKYKAAGVDSIEALYAFYLYQKNPVEIAVAGTSCAGSRNARVRIFPRQKVDVEITLEDNVKVNLQTERRGAGKRAMKQALAAISKIREAGKIAEKVAELAQKKIEVKFLEEVKVRFEAQFKTCTKEKKGFWGNLYTPAHVGLTWKLSFSALCLIGFDIKFQVSLINIVAPGVGEPAATGLRRLGFKADLTFEAKLRVPVTFSLGQDEYDYWTNTGIEIGIKPEFGMYLDLASGINLVRFGAKWPGSLTLAFMAADKPNVLAQLQPKGELKTIFVLQILKDTWFENTWEKEATFLRINWKGPKLDIWTRA